MCVDPKRIGEVFPHVGALLNRALTKGHNITKEDTLSKLESGLYLLWLAASEKIEAIAITQLSGDVCEIVLCAGDVHSRWVHLIEAIEKYANDENCRATRIIGRNGWKRVLPDYKPVRVILEKELK